VTLVHHSSPWLFAQLRHGSRTHTVLSHISFATALCIFSLPFAFLRNSQHGQQQDHPFCFGFDANKKAVFLK
jgi:hypothetical protein